MFKFFSIIIGITLCSSVWCQNKLGGIGSWREHYNNQSVQQVAIATGAGTTIGTKTNNTSAKWLIATTPYQIALVDSKNEIDLIGKSNGLHDMGIAFTAWDSEQ